MANNSSDIDEDCFKMFGDKRYLVLLGIRIFLSFFSCCCLFCVIGLIILFRKYHFMSQRLILYLSSSSLLFSFVQTINFDGHIATKSPTALDYCVFIGFVTQLTIWWEVLAMTCIMIDIFVKSIFQISTEKLEKFYLLFIIVMPLTFSWIPFINGHYGPAGLYCWIRDQNLENCSISDFGDWLRFSLYYIPLYAIMITLIILVIFSMVVVQWRKKRWFGQYSPERQVVHQMIEKEIKPLLWYPLIFIIINIVPLIRRAYSVHDSSGTFFFVLTAIQIVIYRFQGILIGLAFSLDPETRKKLHWPEIKAAFIHLCTRNDMIHQYPAKKCRSDSKNVYSDSEPLTATAQNIYSVNA